MYLLEKIIYSFFLFSDTMTEIIFLKAELDASEVKEECEEEEDPMLSMSPRTKGTSKKTY